MERCALFAISNSVLRDCFRYGFGERRGALHTVQNCAATCLHSAAPIALIQLIRGLLSAQGAFQIKMAVINIAIQEDLPNALALVHRWGAHSRASSLSLWSARNQREMRGIGLLALKNSSFDWYRKMGRVKHLKTLVSIGTEKWGGSSWGELTF